MEQGPDKKKSPIYLSCDINGPRFFFNCLSEVDGYLIFGKMLKAADTHEVF